MSEFDGQQTAAAPEVPSRPRLARPRLAWLLRAPPPVQQEAVGGGAAAGTPQARLGLTPGMLLTLLVADRLIFRL